MTAENSVAAQAGDEPMRAAFWKFIATLPTPVQDNISTSEARGESLTATAFASGYRVAQVSPRATADVERDSAKLKAAIITTLEAHTREMEGYSYFGSNPGVPEDDYEEIADEIIATTKPGA